MIISLINSVTLCRKKTLKKTQNREKQNRENRKCFTCNRKYKK